MSGPILEGVLAINKPPAISSATVIRDVQSHFNPSKLFRPWLDREQSRIEAESHGQKKRRRWKGRKFTDVKMGHGGTLDPMATGVLILGIGSGTKELQHFMTACTKTYETILLFGAATDTYDTEGKIVGRKSHDHITKEKVEEALAKFRGKGMQKPPIFSALRVQGKRLYEYARENKPLPEGFEIQERPVEVSELVMLDWYPGASHQWHWPEREAEMSEKKLAEQALHMKSDTVAVDSNAKRKRADDDENLAEAATEPSPKRAKADDKLVAAESASDVMPATIKRPATAEGSQPDTETSQSRKDEAEAQPSPAGTSQRERSACPAPACRLRMTVTSGFYVRSLCHDLGAALDSLGIMAELSRTRQADFALGSNVLQFEDLKQGEESWGPKVQGLLEQWSEKKATKSSS